MIAVLACPSRSQENAQLSRLSSLSVLEGREHALPADTPRTRGGEGMSKP